MCSSDLVVARVLGVFHVPQVSCLFWFISLERETEKGRRGREEMREREGEREKGGRECEGEGMREDKGSEKGSKMQQVISSCLS